MWDNILKTINHETTPKNAVARWGGDITSIELVSTGINLVYRFKKSDQHYFLRITHSQLMPYAKLESALAFQYYLQKSNVPVCHLVFSQYGKWIEIIDQDEQLFLAHVCKQVPGSPIHFDHDNLSLYENWGAALGKFHKASTKYQTNQHQYSLSENDIKEFTGYTKNEEPVICNALNVALDYFNNLPKTVSNYGLIHGDHRKDNVLFFDNAVNFIDFDLPRYCWFMDDIARPFFSNILKKQMNWQDKLPAYIKGYRSVFPLSSDDLHTFSWFMRYKALNIFLWTKNNWHGEVAPGGVNTKEWLALMREMILNQEWPDQLNKVILKLPKGEGYVRRA